MDYDEAIQRLRTWAARAQHEALEADTHGDTLSWQGQAQVLSSVANLLADQGGQSSEFTTWRRIVADREKSLATWQVRQTGPDVSYFAGEVAGYDLALTTIRDVAGRVWPRIEPHVG